MNDVLLHRAQVLQKLDIEAKRKNLRELEALSMHEGFWKDSASATKTMKSISKFQKEIEEGEIFALLIDENDEAALQKK